jgi:hypothetical protein
LVTGIYFITLNKAIEIKKKRNPGPS